MRSSCWDSIRRTTISCEPFWKVPPICMAEDVRDRIAHLFQIRKTLSSLFRDLDVENEWLREQHTLLDGQEPLKLLLGGSMEDLLLVKEYVDAAAGRWTRRSPDNRLTIHVL